MKTNMLAASHAVRMHPLAAGAAVSVIILSLVGVGALTGIIPNALSQKSSAPATQAVPAVGPAQPCPVCGTVESVRTVALRSNATGLGAITGGVAGGLLGNVFGRGRGNTAMTIVGAAGGAFAGNEIEKNMNKHTAYRITIRMEDGSVRTLSQSSPPPFAVGDKVRVVDGRLVRA